MYFFLAEYLAVGVFLVIGSVLLMLFVFLFEIFFLDESKKSISTKKMIDNAGRRRKPFAEILFAKKYVDESLISRFTITPVS